MPRPLFTQNRSPSPSRRADLPPAPGLRGGNVLVEGEGAAPRPLSPRDGPSPRARELRGPLSRPHRGCGRRGRLPQEAPRPGAEPASPLLRGKISARGRAAFSPRKPMVLQTAPSAAVPRARAAGGARAPSRGQCREDSSGAATGTGHPRAPTPPAAGPPTPATQRSPVTCIAARASSRDPGLAARGLSAETREEPRTSAGDPCELTEAALPGLGGLAAWPPSSPQKHLWGHLCAEGPTFILGVPASPKWPSPRLGPCGLVLCPPPLHPQGGWLEDFRGGQGEPQHPTRPGSSRPLSPSAPPARWRGNREPSFLRFRGEGAADPASPPSQLSPGSAPSLGPTHPPPQAWHHCPLSPGCPPHTCPSCSP